MECQRTAPTAEASLAILSAGAAALGVELDSVAMSRFQRFYELLREHGERYNLTSVRDAEGVQRRHFLESLAIAAALRKRRLFDDGARLLDVGAGAGFPGLPIQIVWPGLKVTLLEATGKKAAFISLVATELGLDAVTVVNARAEEAGRRFELREAFDVVTARAVAPLPALAELTLPFCHVGGIVAAIKGSRLDKERVDAAAAITACGGRDDGEVVLGDGAPVRLLLLRKISPTPAWLPRMPGTPARAPLH